MQEDNNSASASSKKIELVFPESNSLEIEDNKWVDKGSGTTLHKFAASIDDIVGWFNQYQVESIELWVSGAVETEGIIKLAVSAKGEGGLKLTLKPKVTVTQP
jgi:hypothetical protein